MRSVSHQSGAKGPQQTGTQTLQDTGGTSLAKRSVKKKKGGLNKLFSKLKESFTHSKSKKLNAINKKLTSMASNLIDDSLTLRFDAEDGKEPSKDTYNKLNEKLKSLNEEVTKSMDKLHNKGISENKINSLEMIVQSQINTAKENLRIAGKEI